MLLLSEVLVLYKSSGECCWVEHLMVELLTCNSGNTIAVFIFHGHLPYHLVSSTWYPPCEPGAEIYETLDTMSKLISTLVRII